MGNIFDALQHAERFRTGQDANMSAPEPGGDNRPIAPLPEPRTAAGLPVKRQPPPGIEQEMISLYQHIDCRMADIPKRAIQFISSSDGEGVSTVVREFARFASMVLGKTVLIVDAAHRNPSQHLYFDIGFQRGWGDALEQREKMEQTVYGTSNSRLYVSPLVPHAPLSPRIYDCEATSNLLNEMKRRFDLVLIDSSPATQSPDSLAFSRCVDGVVLVVEAEKTRRQVAEMVKGKIEKSGGTVLGVVLNKRRYHIPESIYRRI